jgi:hypothetical protein
MTAKRRKPRRRWRAVFDNHNRQIATVELHNGGWHGYVGDKDCGVVGSEQAAVELAQKINGGADGR